MLTLDLDEALRLAALLAPRPAYAADEVRHAIGVTGDREPHGERRRRRVDDRRDARRHGALDEVEEVAMRVRLDAERHEQPPARLVRERGEELGHLCLV